MGLTDNNLIICKVYENECKHFIGLSIVKCHLRKREIIDKFEKIIYMYCLYYLCMTHTEKYLFYYINFFGYRNVVFFLECFIVLKRLIYISGFDVCVLKSNSLEVVSYIVFGDAQHISINNKLINKCA